MNYLGILTGIAICLGGIIGYLPQFYNIIKYDSVHGISEVTLVLANIGLMCLTMNSLIYSWSYFFNDFSNLLPFISIALSWFMILIYYIIFITYKIQNKHKSLSSHTSSSGTSSSSDKTQKRLLYGLHYAITYLIFTIFVLALSLGEKIQGNMKFFIVFADILGYTSAILNSLVYLPQIYTLWKNKSSGNLSLLMYVIQTPGNVIIIVFQAFLYSAPISTWITYVIVLLEQSIILFLMIYYTYCAASNIAKTEEDLQLIA